MMMPLGSAGKSPSQEFWSGRTVLLTGLTGFKGVWLSAMLQHLGAKVVGISLPPASQPALFDLVSNEITATSHIHDIRHTNGLAALVAEAAPSIVIHMAAQSLVLESIAAPRDTFATNITGTVNLLEALRSCSDVDAVLVITSDKVYANDNSGEPFKETAALGGDDPYSASKACTELVTHAYARNFLEPRKMRTATARAGNVVGGGDWAKWRLIPDLWRAMEADEPLVLRVPDATRPWQHVLDALCGYLLYVEALVMTDGDGLPRSLNFGPIEAPSTTVRELVEHVSDRLGFRHGWRLSADANDRSGPVDKAKLDVSAVLANEVLGWHPRLPTAETIKWTADWYRDYRDGVAPWSLISQQIDIYLDRH